MNLILVYLFCLTAIANGCWKKSSDAPKSTTTTTTTTTTPSFAVDERINEGNIHTSEAARSNPSKKGAKVDTAEIKRLSEELFQLDTNSVGSLLTLSHQGMTSSNDRTDAAPQPLFSESNSFSPPGRTFTLFKKLLDNYVADVKRQEENTKLENAEINEFLDAVMNTKVMNRTEEFLKSKGLLTDSLRRQLYFIWFTPYSRSKGITGSSGFEHVFLGEIKNGEVSGFHNWVYFQKEEQEKDLNYKGYLKRIDLGDRGEVLKMKFDWMNRPKKFGSMFVGTSPELEMALYTLCYYTRPNAGCSLQMNGQRVRIKVYQQTYKGRKVIGSAFPEVF